MSTTPSPDLSSHFVDILARTIPSGVLGEDLRVTIALRPVRVDDDGAAQLETWPSDVESKIAKGPARLELRFPSLGDPTAVTPDTCGSVLESLLHPWPNRSDPAPALKIWHEVIPAPDATWAQIHSSLDTLAELKSGEPEAHAPTCVSGRQGEMVLLAKMLRAMETAQLALADSPVQRAAELAEVVQQVAKRFLDDNKDDLTEIYSERKPGDQARVRNVTQTKLKRAYARKVLQSVKEACAASREVGAKCVAAPPDEAANALVKATLKKLAEGLVCLIQGTDVAADRKIEALYKRLFELRQHFLFAAALDSGVLTALEKSETVSSASGPRDIAEDAVNPEVAKSQGDINLKDTPARTRLASLEESPDLGRLFRLFVDFRLSALELLPHLAGKVRLPDGGILALVRLASPNLSKSFQDQELSRWTLAKFRLDETGGKILSFLPASREELVLAQTKCDPARARSLLHQLDGVYMLGGTAVGVDPAPASGLAELTVPAYELVSADLRGAAREIDSRADRLLSAAASSAASIQSQTQKSGLRSGGLSIVSFSAAPRTSRMIGTSQAAQGRACGETFLDAEDLSMGRLPMFGFLARREAGAPLVHQWFIQTRKRVRFLERRLDGRSVNVDRLISQLYPGDLSPNGPRRLAQASTDRTVPRVFNIADEGQAVELVASVDAAEVTFLGDPMGVETGLESGEQILDHQSNDLLMDREISLFGVEDGDDAAVMPVRFGMQVLGAFTAVYLGGAALSPAEAAERLIAIPEATVPRRRGEALPEGRRYLRSEPVAAPQILIPKSEADATVAAYGPGGGPDFPPQTTGQIALRTRMAPNGKIEEQLDPTQILRVVLPPIVSLEFAEKHAAFDEVRPKCFPGKRGAYPVVAVENVPLFPTNYHRPGRALRPRDGLRTIHVDAGFGGYPVLRYDIGAAADRPAIVSAVFDDGRGWLEKARAWARASERDPGRAGPLSPSPVGDAVFAPIGSKTVDQGRTIPFYPDPMASRLVIRFRSGSDLLSRDSVQTINIPMTDPRAWPDVVPVVLVITNGGSNRPVLEYRDERLTVSGIACRKVTVNLRPGLSGTLDMWGVPSKEQLAQWSELIDTAASLDCFPSIKGSWIPSLCGCGILGTDAPDSERLNAVATRLYEELLTHPVPELAEPRSIELVHATTRPREGVGFSNDDAKPALALRRAAVGAKSDGLGDPLLPQRPSDLPPGWDVQPPANEASVVELGGFVSVDLASTSSVEIIARAVAPTGNGFDDAGRGRGRRNVNCGRAETVIDPSDGRPRLPQDVEIYGFKISPQGAVDFPKSEQLWARFSSLPQSLAGLDPSTPAWLSLHSLFRNSGRDIVADIRPLFGDTRARQVQLRFTALSRHAGAFVHRPRIRSGSRYVGEPLPAQATSLTQKDWSESLWLPASDRPGTPVAAAQAHPLVAEEDVREDRPFTVTKRRLCQVRLWLQRPWFTSGEGERLGIVLWPRLSRIAGKSVLRGRVKTPTLYERPSLGDSEASTGQEDYMSLSRFEDRYLTGASRFVTRWGSDASEAFPKQGWRDWVVPYEIFEDFKFDVKEGTVKSRREDAVFVAKAAMPIPDANKNPADGGEDIQKRQRFLNVDLLTYEPRFDIDREQWYVDIPLNPSEMISPFLRLGIVRYQEHAPRDLQVSFPGEPFVFQLFTRRQSSLELKPDATDGSRVRLELTVSGPATRDDGKEAGPIDATVVTKMIFRLQGLDGINGLPVLSSKMTVGVSGDGSWKGTFLVSRQVVANPGLDLSVHIEERAFRPPTSYPDDFFNANRQEEEFRIGSPRYACSIVVPKVPPRRI
ncbi:hypothetical protein ABIA22_004668 [Sinorhizobium fredii]|uniref:hypothetical protein n=1 Tax=Rhizobium fredii TaxID=380 RepID=UPI0035145087